MDVTRAKCPKCGRWLAAGGVLTIAHLEIPVYTCDECLVTVDLFGQKHELPLTFCLDKEGRAVDPADPETPLEF